MQNLATRNDVKQLAEKIELLAKEVQNKLTNGADFIAEANELVRNNITFVFTIGELSALEQSASMKVKKVPATVVNTGNSMDRKYHNVRDTLGRFTRKI